MMSVSVAMFVLQDRHKEANMQIFLDLTVHLFVTTNTLLCCKKYYLQNIFIFVVVVLFFPQIYHIKRRPPNFLLEFSF